MKAKTVKELKAGIPLARGFEVKSVSFHVEAKKDLDLDASLQISERLKTWLEVETKCQIDDFQDSVARKCDFENPDEKIFAKVFYEIRREVNIKSFEIQIVTPFFKGVETTRVRLVAHGELTQVEVSSFMESKDATRAIHEVPRLADSLIASLLEIPNLSFFVDGVRVLPSPQVVDSSNIRITELAKAGTLHRLPLIGFPNTSQGKDVAARVAFETAGIAVTVLVATDIFGDKRRSFFVYWRDGTKIEWHQDMSDLYKVLRQFNLRGLRNESFMGTWRLAQNRLVGTIEKPAALGSSSLGTEEVSEEILGRLADALRIINEVTLERDSFIAEFDETQKRWKKALEEAQKKNAKLFALGARQDVDLNEFQIHPILSGSGLDAMFADLTATTQGAIVFTERVTRSWLEAQKRGYGKPGPMEEALEKLCRFAIGYKLAKGVLGMTRRQFANSFDLELEEADDKLPNKVFEYHGKIYNQEHHIRADQKRVSFNTLGRIHFDFDFENSRIVVNHIGGKQYENDKS
jgi:hypothetical protein